MRKSAIVAGILALVAAALFYFFAGGDAEGPAYRLGKVERGAIVSAVSASGILNAVVTVQVGSQVSGQIKELAADYNTEVRAGQVIARIDPDNFAARLRQSEAELAVAEATVATRRAAVSRADAELKNSRAALAAARAAAAKADVAITDTKRDLVRAAALKKRGVVSASQVDKAEAAYDGARAEADAAQAQIRAQESVVLARDAQIDMAKADVQHAIAQVAQRQAALGQAQVDLDHTVIRSPVDGVVIARSVDVGQIVAASLQAPTLFTIAQDLKEMQVEASVDEADIGRILVGQRASFSVDSFPGRTFKGRVTQIRKAPQSVQNVVTYTSVISAANPALRLLPGMTANVEIVVDERESVLKLPNAALRFRPPGASARAPAGQDRAGAGAAGGMEERIRRMTEALALRADQQQAMRAIFAEIRDKAVAARRAGAGRAEIRDIMVNERGRGRAAMLAVLDAGQREKFEQFSRRRAVNPSTRGRVWVVRDGGEPVPVDVVAGISDGGFTEILRGDLAEGAVVAVGIQRKAANSRARRIGF